MAKKQEKTEKRFTTFVSRERVATLCTGDTFLDDALRRISARGKDILLTGSRVYVTFGENLYEVRGADGLAGMLAGIAYEGVSTNNNIGIEITDTGS